MKIAFLDRDGTLIFEPPDTKQIDSIERLKILDNVFESLKLMQEKGYKLIMVTNQDGLGGKNFPKERFDKPQKELLRLFKKQGIKFYKILVCPHKRTDGCICRKPNIGLVKKLFEKEEIDKDMSFMVGDRETDEQFAINLNIAPFRMNPNGSFPRLGFCARKTAETDISIMVNLDGKGQNRINTGINFFDHMLSQISKHSLIDIYIKAAGDLKVDEHHTVEDVAICLGEALLSALGSKRSIKRYGFLLPMDDTLAEVALDLGGRPYLVFNCNFKRERVGDLPTELVEHFFKSLSESLKANIHINVRYSRNEHHLMEAVFKAFGKAAGMACEKDSRIKGIPSTKEIL